MAGIGFDGAAQRYTVGFGVEQLRFAAEHQAAVGLVERLIFVEHHAHIHIGLDVAQAHRAAELHRAAALEAQALDQPTLPLQARAQAAVVEHKADFAVAVKQIVAVERAVKRRLAHAPANRRFAQQAAAQALSDGQEIAKSIQIGRADAQSAADGREHNVVAELLADHEVAAHRAITGHALERAVDAAVLKAGVERERAQAQHLLAVGQLNVTALAADIEIAACVLAVG